MGTNDVVRKLIRACVDDERTLQHECKFVGPGRSAHLMRLARERRQFVGDLERLAAPGQAAPGGSLGELLREALRNLRVVAGGPNSGDAIASCRQSRSRTQACYDRALLGPMADEPRCVLESQRRRLDEEALGLSRLEL